MKHTKLKLFLLILLFLFQNNSLFSQIDSVAIHIIEKVKDKLEDKRIPRKTFFDKIMYPHRWYVKQLLKPRKIVLDTNYIGNYKQRLTLTLPVVKKFYEFNLRDINTNNAVKFTPNNYYQLGLNFSNIILTFGFYPGIKFGSNPSNVATRSVDFQVTFIGKKIVTDINYQNYIGFNTQYYNGTNNVLNFDSVYLQRPNIELSSIGVNSLYVFNAKKYSLRGAFSFTDIQKKSAGSLVMGVYHSNVTLKTKDSILISNQALDKFTVKFKEIKDINQKVLGISIGYGYNFTFYKFTYSIMAIGGAGIQKTFYTNYDKAIYNLPYSLATQLNVKTALRYDTKYFFIGVMGTYDRNFSFNSSVFNNDKLIGRALGFVGYRFKVKTQMNKILTKMKLINY